MAPPADQQGSSRNSSRTGSPSGVEDEARALLGRGPPPLRPFNLDTLKSAILHARPGTGEVRQALESCTFQPRVKGFTALVKFLGDLRSSDKAKEVLWAMEGAAGVKPNTYTYTSVISACSRCGDWESAVEVFESMKVAARSDPECLPNHVTYSTLIMSCEKGGDWRRALRYYHELVGTGFSIDQGTFTAAVSSCLRSDTWRGTLDILDRMHGAKYTAPPALYRDLLVKYAAADDWKKAEEVFLLLQEWGVPVDDHMCRALMEVYERGDLVYQVIELLKTVRNLSIGIDVDTYNCALRTIAKEGDWENARRVLDRMIEQELHPNKDSIDAVAAAFEKAGKSEEAEILRKEYEGRV